MSQNEREAVAKRFGKENGFGNVWFYKNWNGYAVFNAEEERDAELITGYPFYILVGDNNTPRLANAQEVLELMGFS